MEDSRLVRRRFFSSEDIGAVLAAIRGEARRIFRVGKHPVFLGRDHLVSPALAETALNVFPSLAVFYSDAYVILRDDYLGERLSHVCVMRRILEIEGIDPLHQFGIRSGTREEFNWKRANDGMRLLSPVTVKLVMRETSDRAICLTTDVDMVNPCEMPRTGSPEPRRSQLRYAHRLHWSSVGCRCSHHRY